MEPLNANSRITELTEKLNDLHQELFGQLRQLESEDQSAGTSERVTTLRDRAAGVAACLRVAQMGLTQRNQTAQLEGLLLQQFHGLSEQRAELAKECLSLVRTIAGALPDLPNNPIGMVDVLGVTDAVWQARIRLQSISGLLKPNSLTKEQLNKNPPLRALIQHIHALFAETVKIQQLLVAADLRADNGGLLKEVLHVTEILNDALLNGSKCSGYTAQGDISYCCCNAAINKQRLQNS